LPGRRQLGRGHALGLCLIINPMGPVGLERLSDYRAGDCIFCPLRSGLGSSTPIAPDTRNDNSREIADKVPKFDF
jgi:hypothetical protein